MDQRTLADRLVGVMRRSDEAKEILDKLCERPSDTPRFELTLAVDEHINGLHSSFITAWSNIDRLYHVARKLLEQQQAEKAKP